LNVVLVTRFYPPDTGGGGIAAYARYAAVGFIRAGHQVRVISAMVQGSKAKQVVNGVEVVRISPPLRSHIWTRIPLLGRQMRFVRDLAYAWRVRETLLKMSGEFRPDIVEYADIDAEGIFHPIQLCPYVVKLHTPHVVLSTYYSDNEVPYARRGIEWLEANAIRRAAGISSPSLYLAAEIEKLMKFAHERIQYVPNFIDTDVYSPCLSGLEDEFLVLYVGRLEERKGALVFAQAIPQIANAIPQAKFIFLGADRASKKGQSQQGELLQFFEQSGVQERVEFYGHASPEVFLSFYRKASVFVLPSLFENSPYTLLEAISCGKACVVSRSGGMPEMLVDGDSGVFYQPGNSKDLAEKLIELLQDPKRRKSLGQVARQRAELEYSTGKGTEKTLAFYESVLKEHIPQVRP